MKYQLGSLKNPGVQALFEAHHAEVGDYPKASLSLNLDALLKAEDMGVLKTYTAEDETGVVGYNTFIVSEDIRRKNSLAATEVALYMVPWARAKHAKEFIRFVDDSVQADILYRATTVKKDYGKLLEKVGYLKVANSYAKYKTVEAILN